MGPVTPIIIGGGQLAAALAQALPGSWVLGLTRGPSLAHGARPPFDVASQRSLGWISLADADQATCHRIERFDRSERRDGPPAPLVYAHGPAGDAACRQDLAGALRAHVLLPAELRAAFPDRLIVYLSTLAAETQWYGAMKRAGEHLVRVQGSTRILRLGAVLDPAHRRGVASTFFQAVVRGESPRVPVAANPVVVITTIPDVVHVVEAALRPEADPMQLIGLSMSVWFLATRIAWIHAALTGGEPVPVLTDPTLEPGPDYGAIPLEALHDISSNWNVESTLRTWIKAGLVAERIA